MVAAVSAPPPSAPPRGLRRIFAWQRVVIVLGLAASLGLLISVSYPQSPAWNIAARQMLVALVAMAVFGFFETHPAKLPRFVPRWLVQVFAVEAIIPIAFALIYFLTTGKDQLPFYKDAARMRGFGLHTMSMLFISPWIVVGGLFAQRDAEARRRELQFGLEKSELERQALDSRVRLLQAQVEPHFLFNTLANVRELVVSGSPQAPEVLDSLIQYLRGAVPQLNQTSTTLGQEVKLVRSYLELMQMRMPDRLQFAMQVDQQALGLQCPPATLLTLVENAIRHGVDPSETGGKIDVCIRASEGRCCVQVRNTGIALGQSTNGLGTGLSSLRERLQLIFGDKAQLRLYSLDPPGTSAEVEFPAQVATP